MQFPFIKIWYYSAINDSNDKTLTFRKINEYASERGASELGKFSHFHILKCYFLQYSVGGTSDTLSQKHIYFQVSNYICIIIYIHNQYSSLLLLMVYKTLYIKRQYTDKTLTLRKSMYMRAERASLAEISHFYILKLLFLSIFCRYTSDILCRY